MVATELVTTRDFARGEQHFVDYLCSFCTTDINNHLLPVLTGVLLVVVEILMFKMVSIVESKVYF